MNLRARKWTADGLPCVFPKGNEGGLPKGVRSTGLRVCSPMECGDRNAPGLRPLLSILVHDSVAFFRQLGVGGGMVRLGADGGRDASAELSTCLGPTFPSFARPPCGASFSS